MKRSDNYQKYLLLRKQHPEFVYQDFSYRASGEVLEVEFTFSAGPGMDFKPRLKFHPGPGRLAATDPAKISSIVFHLGMIEMLSYWKAFCSPRAMILPFELTASQQAWWQKLYLAGLGEFLYTNGIPIPEKDFVRFDSPPGTPSIPARTETPSDAGRVLVPVGGGKDSAVSIELLKGSGMQLSPFAINPRGAIREVVAAAGFAEGSMLTLDREIDPFLLELNEHGYLNGHTPFSAMLAFASLLTARLAGIRHIALSNESSANEPSVPGTMINHQYSKSLEFERDFRTYTDLYVGGDLNYFSLLRPLNELQIAAMFSRHTQYHQAFKSCNAGSKTDRWCGICPKCLFTFIILSPFMPSNALKAIFGHDLFADASLLATLDDLTGVSPNKPFECVGTVEEVNVALAHVVACRLKQGNALPPLLNHYRQGPLYPKHVNTSLQPFMRFYGRDHFLPPFFDRLLGSALPVKGNLPCRDSPST